MAQTLVDSDEQELRSLLMWEMKDSETAQKIAAVIRRMIENALIEAGVKSND